MPVQPALPEITTDRLESLDDDTFWSLMDRERRLVDWSLEMRSMLEVLCDAPVEW